MDKARFALLFQRYTDQTCTTEERQEFLKFMAEAEYDDQLKALLDDHWNTLQTDEKLPPDRTEWILHKIFQEENKIVPINRKLTVFSVWRKAAAAVIVAMLSLAALYYVVSDRKENDTLTAHTRMSATGHQFIKLPDGSTVLLNTGSTLVYKDSFWGKASREVSLIGEGYFDIKYDAARAFIVHTGKLKTTVLGTAFNIKAYPNEKDIIVTVTRGKVKVSDDNKLFHVITPDQQITFDKDVAQVEQQTVDSRSIIAWTDNDIFFDDVALADAALQLEQRFHVTITFANSALQTCRFTATFMKGESLEQILEVICSFNGAKYNNDGVGNIRISGDGCDVKNYE